MREILFRGKRVDSGEWVEGDLLTKRNALSEESAIVFFEDDYIIPKSHTVDKKTIGQFTGLTDKNGVKIFEGDVVSVHDALLRCDEKYHEFIGSVSFDRASFMIEGNGGMIHYRWADYDIEVIGTIHDKPELLEGN